MLDHEGYLAYFERFKMGNKLKLRPGKRVFYRINDGNFDNRNNVENTASGPLRLNSGLYGNSGRRKIAFVDWDQDGDLDLIVNSVNAALFENLGTENGKVNMKFIGNLSDQKLAGHTTSPTIVDWDKNGIPDYYSERKTDFSIISKIRRNEAAT